MSNTVYSRFKHVIFDVDQTLIDTSMLEPYRQKREWRIVFSLIKNCYLYPNIKNILNCLYENRIKISLVSTAPRHYIEKIAETFGIPYDCIVGYGDARLKPSPDPMLLAMSIVNVDAQDTISFGDREIDIISSQKAKITCCACYWGTSEEHKLVNSRADYNLYTPFKINDILFCSNDIQGSYLHWESHNFNNIYKFYYFFYYYLPNAQIHVASYSSIKARALIFEFKDGNKNTAFASTLVAKIKESFADPSLLTLVCIPASSISDNYRRYFNFMKLVCDELHMGNSYGYVHILKEKSPKHLGGTDQAEYFFDDKFFSGKNLLLFDDVVTKGNSMHNFILKLEAIGAKVVACISIGKTTLNNQLNNLLKHPCNNEDVICLAEHSSGTDKTVFVNTISGDSYKSSIFLQKHNPLTSQNIEIKHLTLNSNIDNKIYQFQLRDISKPVFKGYSLTDNIKDKKLVLNRFRNLKISNTVNFGSYNNHPIKWIILDKCSDYMVLISKYAIESRPYHDQQDSVSWYTCDLRRYLNNYFFQNVFTECEKQLVVPLVDTIHLKEGKKVYKDYVSILNIDEYKYYFFGNDLFKWKCEFFYHKQIQCWLRDTGRSLKHAAFVGRSGRLHYGGSFVNSARNAIRPIIRIKF